MEPSDHDKIPLCKILYFVGHTGLQAEWGIGQKIVAVQVSPCAPVLLTLMQEYLHVFLHVK
jgi:hypothetical protein